MPCEYVDLWVCAVTGWLAKPSEQYGQRMFRPEAVFESRTHHGWERAFRVKVHRRQTVG
jgi:hypothetical protein